MDILNLSLDEVFEEMTRLKLVYRVSTLQYTKSVWVEVSGSYNGVEIKCEETIDGTKERVGAVVRRVFAKWYAVANAGCGGMLSPPIEAKAVEHKPDPLF